MLYQRHTLEECQATAALVDRALGYPKPPTNGPPWPAWLLQIWQTQPQFGWTMTQDVPVVDLSELGVPSGLYLYPLPDEILNLCSASSLLTQAEKDALGTIALLRIEITDYATRQALYQAAQQI